MAYATSSPSPFSLYPFLSTPLRPSPSTSVRLVPAMSSCFLSPVTPPSTGEVDLSLPLVPPTNKQRRAQSPLPCRPPPASANEVELAFPRRPPTRASASSIFPSPRCPPKFKTKPRRRRRRRARRARAKAAALGRSGAREIGGKLELELADAWRGGARGGGGYASIGSGGTGGVDIDHLLLRGGHSLSLTAVMTPPPPKMELGTGNDGSAETLP
uniref:Uncharacterized protein n=1 Tax=Oryza meridionalis TaxID=40149 RepID=A0A0E0DRZ3_9ORYZ